MQAIDRQNVPTEPTTGMILAGGQSRRMGTDKRRLRLWGDAGPTLLEHTVALISSLCSETIVVMNDAADWPHLAGRHIPDSYADGGALGGIYSGLQAATHPYALVVGADMPFLNHAVLTTMLQIPRSYDVLLPRSPVPEAARNRMAVEPLHAIYHRTCLPAIKSILDAGQRKIAAFFPLVHIQYIDATTLAAHDPDGRSFRNVNTPDELAQIHPEIHL